MNGLKMADKKPLYLGFVLLVLGFAAKRIVETTLVSDARIESPQYLAVIYSFQLLAIAVGLFLLIKRPVIRLPGTAEITLLTFSIFIAFVLLEIGARVWFNTLATPEQYDRYVLFTDLEAEDFACTPHPYLSYYPTPGSRNGQTFQNSLAYRNDEFPLEKQAGVFRIVVLGGFSTNNVRIADNHQTFTSPL